MADEKIFYVGEFGETIENSDSEDLIKQAELFSTGVHRGVEYTEDDLDELVKNFSADEEIPIQIDHSSSAKDTVGYLDKVKRDGSKLLGEVRIVDEFAKQRVKSKLMKKLSSSFYLKLSEEGMKPYKLREVSLVAFPQVKSARLFSENGYATDYENDNGGANVTKENKTVEGQVDLEQIKKEVKEQAEAQVHEDFAKLQEQIKELTKVQEKFNETQVTNKVEKFSASNKVVPAQKDSLTKLLSSFSDEQMEAFEEFMSNSQKVDFNEAGEVDGDTKVDSGKSKEEEEFDKFYEEYTARHGKTL